MTMGYKKMPSGSAGQVNNQAGDAMVVSPWGSGDQACTLGPGSE